jgi:hypothetical protein
LTNYYCWSNSLNYYSNQAPGSIGYPRAVSDNDLPFSPNEDYLDLKDFNIHGVLIESSYFPSEYTTVFTFQANTDEERFFASYNSPYIAVSDGTLS